MSLVDRIDKALWRFNQRVDHWTAGLRARIKDTARRLAHVIWQIVYTVLYVLWTFGWILLAVAFVLSFTLELTVHSSRLAIWSGWILTGILGLAFIFVALASLKDTWRRQDEDVLPRPGQRSSAMFIGVVVISLVIIMAMDQVGYAFHRFLPRHAQALLHTALELAQRHFPPRR